MAEQTEEENIEALWQEYEREKTVAVRNRIAEYYLPLVRLVAGRIAISLPQHVDREDLLSSGFFGLLDAIERYELARGNKFETYAGVRVRGAMLDHLRAKDWEKNLTCQSRNCITWKVRSVLPPSFLWRNTCVQTRRPHWKTVP